MGNKMFCYQCQETAGCKGCTRMGVCGKTPEVAAMQDLLVYVTKGISAVTTAMRREGGEVSPEVNHLITLNLFTTITNANFDREAIEARVRMTLEAKAALLGRLSSPAGLPEAALWDGSGSWEEKAAAVGVLSTEHEDIRSLRELITYGLKGLSAYSKHANALLREDGEVDAFLQKALAATLDDSLTAEQLVALTLETGKYGVQGMALLDQANTGAYGNPEITSIVADEYETVRLCMEHFASTGRKKVALVCARPRSELELLRIAAWRNAVLDAGLSQEWVRSHCLSLDLENNSDAEDQVFKVFCTWH